MNQIVERISLYQDGECWVAQYAINGHPCLPFYVHKSTVEKFATEDEFMRFMERKAFDMLEIYGQRVN